MEEMLTHGKIDSNTYFRQEKNGLILYNLIENRFRFYKDIFVEKKEELEKLDLKDNDTSLEIDLQYPICVCCLVENRCNLDCIYCFGDDKMYAREKNLEVQNVYKSLLAVNPIQVSLGGGEPTLNSQLIEIIQLLSESEIAVVLDTNGTTGTLKKFIPILKKSGVLVRVSVDSFDDNIINEVRPLKEGKTYKVSALIKKNIDLLLSNDIPVSIHTVMTQKNKNCILDIANYLSENSIKRWHIDGVKYSKKNRIIFEELAVTKLDILAQIELLREYSNQINITFSYEEDSAPNVRLFFDVNGKFLVDSVYDGLKYIDREGSIKNIYQYLDKKRHIKRYLGDFYL